LVRTYSLMTRSNFQSSASIPHQQSRFAPRRRPQAASLQTPTRPVKRARLRRTSVATPTVGRPRSGSGFLNPKALCLEKKSVSPECVVLGNLRTASKQGSDIRAEQCVCAVRSCKQLPAMLLECTQRGAVNSLVIWKSPITHRFVC
jgi:hypothetical protein